jgi:hypothetical protein
VGPSKHPHLKDWNRKKNISTTFVTTKKETLISRSYNDSLEFMGFHNIFYYARILNIRRAHPKGHASLHLQE